MQKEEESATEHIAFWLPHVRQTKWQCLVWKRASLPFPFTSGEASERILRLVMGSNLSGRRIRYFLTSSSRNSKRNSNTQSRLWFHSTAEVLIVKLMLSRDQKYKSKSLRYMYQVTCVCLLICESGTCTVSSVFLAVHQLC